jgi:hypothetical protein
MRKLMITVGAVMAISGAAAPLAGAASNPFGTGQPGAFSGTSCGQDLTSTGGVNATVEPNGFLTAGFANAGSVYANPGTTPGAANAVSEYDIACYQLTQNSH